MTETVIRASHLKKYFKQVKAVDDISFEIKRGELFGFLGINGAGKSTTSSVLCHGRPTAERRSAAMNWAKKTSGYAKKSVSFIRIIVWMKN